MRRDTLPYSVYYYGHPSRYIHPMQSKYHNLGQYNYQNPLDTYPGRRGGIQGDWGPRQAPDLPNNYPYPLDVDGCHMRKILAERARTASDILC